jgi:hypothetical protein
MDCQGGSTLPVRHCERSEAISLTSARFLVGIASLRSQ